MPKHKRPTNRRKTFNKAVVAGATGAMVLSASPALASGEWDVIADCESGGQNVESQSTISSASGYFQITDGTWKSAGGTEFAPRAIDATKEQQAIVAQRIAERRGSLADWDASRGCWGDKISSAVPAAAPAKPKTASAPVAPKPAPPAPSTVKKVATAQAQPAKTYTVVEGDTLVKIAEHLGTDWHKLAELNNISDPHTLHIGQVLRVDKPGVKYVVKVGDELRKIAPTLGVTTMELYEQNHDVIGNNPDLIFPGQVFFVGGLPLAKAPVKVEEEKVVEEKPKGNETVEAKKVAVPQATGTAIITNSAGPVHARTQAAANSVFSNVRGASLIDFGGTRGSAIDPNGHPSGNAIDYMVMEDTALGNAIFQYHMDHWNDLGVDYVIWQQRYYNAPGPLGSGKLMDNRGSNTQNHMDHVHVNYNP